MQIVVAVSFTFIDKTTVSTPICGFTTPRYIRTCVFFIFERVINMHRGSTCCKKETSCEYLVKQEINLMVQTFLRGIIFLMLYSLRFTLTAILWY